MHLKLEKITEKNFESVIELDVHQWQKDYIPDNSYSLIESKFHPTYQPYAICNTKTTVGFIMFELVEKEDRMVECEIFRFMIDKAYQKIGIGAKALRLLIGMIERNTGAESILICYSDDNLIAKNLYRKLGFQKVGINQDGEIMAQIKLFARCFS